MTLMYIHGYGSNGNAMKGQQLRKMMPGETVVSPTFDYDHQTPWQIQEQIRETVEKENVKMIVGSSFGGYQTLCATAFFHGPILAINPVHDVTATIRRIIRPETDNETSPDKMLEIYSEFNKQVFQRLCKLNQDGCWPDDTPLHFALSTDDELLGDHHPLLEMFPIHRKVFWKDHCGHRFVRFEELKDEITAIVEAL